MTYISSPQLIDLTNLHSSIWEYWHPHKILMVNMGAHIYLADHLWIYHSDQVSHLSHRGTLRS